MKHIPVPLRTCWVLVATWLVLSPATARATNYYNGILHTPLGAAAIFAEPGAGSLAISGIGASGNDGVKLLTGNGGGATTRLGLFNPDTLSVDAYLRWAAFGSGGAKLQDVTLQRVATGGAIFADFTGLGAPTVTVALYRGDRLIGFANGIPPTQPLATFTGGLPVQLDPCILHPEDCYGVIDIVVWQPDPMGPVGSLVALPGQPFVEATRLQIQPDLLPAETTPSPVPVSEVQITGRNLGTWRLGNSPAEGLVYFGLEHQVVGSAQYRFDPTGALVVETPAGSGPNGVVVNLQQLPSSTAAGGATEVLGPPRNIYLADWVALNPQPLPPGARDALALRAVGDWNGRPGTFLGSLSVQSSAAGGMQLISEFSAVGASRQRVELWRGCTVVSSFTVANGMPVVSMPETISGTQLSAALGDDDTCGTVPFPPIPPPWWWWVSWPYEITVQTPSGLSIQVDRLRVAPDDVTGTLAAISQITYDAPGYGSLQFTREAARRQGLNFDGNQHFPIGQARLTKSAAGELILDRLGASGQDGMEIALGQSGFCEVASPGLPLPPPGSSCVFDYRAVLDRIADRTAARFTMAATATGELQCAGDMSPLGATRYTLLVLDGDTRIAEVTNQPAATFSLGGNLVAVAPSLRWDIQRYKCYIRIKVPKLPGSPGPQIRLGPGLAVNGDNVIVIPENPVRSFGAQNRLLLTAVHPEPKHFAREELGVFANGHTGLGQARLHANGQSLLVDHLGTNGEDGVRIDLESSRDFLATFASLDVPAVQGPHPWPWIQASAWGVLGGTPVQNLGSLRFTAATPGVVQVQVDFAPVGSAMHTIEVWRNGAMVQRFTGHTGTVAVLNQFPSGIGKLGGVDPSLLSCFITPLGAIVPIAIGGGPTILGDEIRVLAENTAAPLGNVQAFNLQASGISSFTIVSETRTAAPPFMPCPTGPIVLTLPCSATCATLNYSLPTVQNGRLVECTPAPGTCLPAGVHSVVCRASNEVATSQCTFNVQVIATPSGPPVLVCPSDLMRQLSCFSNCIPVDYIPPTVQNGALAECIPASGTCLPAGTQTVTCRGTNACSEALCRFTIRVDPIQAEPPTIQCPSDLIVSTCGTGEALTYPMPIVTGAAPGSYSLNCIPPAGSFFPIGTNPVVCCLTDLCGQRICCAFNVIVPGGLTFSGNQHCPLGAATLAREAAANSLVIGNISSSGRDGVQITLGDADFGEVITPFMASPGDSSRFEYRAEVDRIADRPAAFLTITGNAAGELVFTGDLSPLGATRYTVIALNGETFVGGVSNQPNATLTVAGAAAAVATSLRWEIKTYKCYIRIKLPKLPGNPGPLLRLSPGLAVNGDSVIILPENPVHTLGRQSRVLLTATALHGGTKLILGEQLGLFGIGHTSLGDSALTANGGTLTVGNLGMSGDRGVIVDVQSAGDFLASLPPEERSVLHGPSPFRWLQSRAKGRFGSELDHDLGSLRFTDVSPTAMEVEVRADFSGVGATTQTVEVWQSGQLVRRLTGQTGPVGTLNGWPSGVGHAASAAASVGPGLRATFTGGVRLSRAGGLTIDGDELRVLPENPAAPMVEWQQVHFQSFGFDTFTIVNELREPSRAPSLGSIGPAPGGGGLQLTVPTAFGYQYTIDSVNALGPHPWPWAPFKSFAGDGSVKVVPIESPDLSHEFFRVGVEYPDPGPLAGHGDAEEPHKIFMDLVNVIVDEARNQGGDRPYFATIRFQTRFFTANSTTVELREYEPHDWVSKNEFNGNGTLLKGKDRMLPQDSLPIPPWMGSFEWDNIEWNSPTDLIAEFLQDPLNFKPKIMLNGAVILALDNHNTPPHMVRDLLNQMTEILRQQLVAQVESGNILMNVSLLNLPQALAELQARFKALSGDMVAQLKIDAPGLFVGSLFDPDVPVGVNLLLFSAVPGIPPVTSADTIGLLNSSIGFETLVRTPENFATTLRFTGMNASYRVNVLIVPDFVPAPPVPNQPDPTLVDTLIVFTHTGEDDLRGSGEGQATITMQGRSPETFRLNGINETFEKRSDHTRIITLSSPVPYLDLQSITLRVVQGQCDGCTSDNWDVGYLDVKCSGPTIGIRPLFSKGGAPLVRLVENEEHPEKNEFRQKTFPFSH